MLIKHRAFFAPFMKWVYEWSLWMEWEENNPRWLDAAIIWIIAALAAYLGVCELISK